MITTKKARKVLTKAEQNHLRESKIRSMASLECQINFMKKTQPEDPWKICPDCFRIARKLGVIKP